MEVDSDSGIDYYPPILTNAKKKGRRRIIEEEDEENSIKIQKEMERMEIFKQLVAELDDCIERAFCNYYKSTLEEFKKFLDTPAKDFDLLPTLILGGQCIQWNRFYEIIKKEYPNFVLVPNEFEWEEEEEIDEIFKQSKGKNLLIFLHANNLYKDETFKNIFSHIQNRGSTYLVLYSPTTFTNILERLSRQITTKMNIKQAIFPQSGGFLRFLLDGQFFTLGFMPKNCILFHGKTLATAQQHFQCESRSLVGLRKILALALHDFAFHGESGQIELWKEKREQFRQTMNLYSAQLQGLANISGEDRFELHINIQSNAEYFPTFYEKMKIQWMGMIRDEWRIKFKELNELVQNPLISEETRNEYEKLSNSLKKQETTQLDVDENNPPKSTVSLDASTSTNSPGRKNQFPIRKPKPSTFLAEQERKRLKMQQNTLPEELRNKIFAFMDNLFDKKKFILPVAGPGDIISNCVVDD